MIIQNRFFLFKGNKMVLNKRKISLFSVSSFFLPNYYRIKKIKC